MMYVKIHRGTAQIGGSLVEIGTEKARLMFDAGVNLPPLDGPAAADDIQIEGLTTGKNAFDGVFISHHHNDHCGLLERVLPGVPVYTGRETARILEVISDFTDRPRPAITEYFKNGGTTERGGISVTPIAVDHSAKDAYMFLVCADGKSVLYTGDFRDARRVPPKVKRILGEGKKLDILITEGANMRADRPGGSAAPRNEKDVENLAAKYMELYDGTVFVLSSSTNHERVKSMIRAANRTDRVVCEDLFQTSVRGSAERGVRRFIANAVTKESAPRSWPYFERLYAQKALVGAESLANSRGRKVVFVRTSMRDFIERYLNARRRIENDVLIYSVWSGYKNAEKTRGFIGFCEQKGMAVKDVHCSGHALPKAIRQLIEELSPAAVLPVHCEPDAREKFRAMHASCIMPCDGERVEV